MERGCHFDGPSRGLHLDDSNETSHYEGPYKENYLEKDFATNHLDGSDAEVMSHFWNLETIGIKVEEPTNV